MRTKLIVAATFLLAACNDTSAPDTANAADAATPPPWNSAASNLTVDGLKPTAAPSPFAPTRLADGPDGREKFEDRGGIAINLGEVSTPLRDVISGRWAYNCNTGAGALSFYRDGRFKAPGGSGRYTEKDYRITFTFADGATETWTLNLSQSEMWMETKTNHIARVLCSKTP